MTTPKGGARENAGRPRLSSEPTKILTMRLPESLHRAVRSDPKGARAALAKWAKKTSQSRVAS